MTAKITKLIAGLQKLTLDERREILLNQSQEIRDRLLYADLTLEPYQIPPSHGDERTILFLGGVGSGKMIDLETDLPTPNGFIKLKDLKEGDQLFDENGSICNIIQLHPIDNNPISYRVIFDDGSTIDACKDRLWTTVS